MSTTSPLYLVHELAAELGLSSSAKTALTALYLRYAFAFIDSATFTAEANRLFVRKGHEQLRPTRTQRSIRHNGDLLLHVKGWVFHEFCRTSSRCSASLSQSSTFKVSLADRRLLQEALSNLKLRRGLTGMLMEGYIPIDLARAEEMLQTALQSRDYQTYAGKYVSKKLIFLSKSYGYRVQEIMSDLVESSLFSMLRMFPSWPSPGFLLSVCKMSTKRRGNNLIKECTTQKRQALLQDAQGNFHAVNVSWELMLETQGDSVQGSTNIYGDTDQGYFDSATVHSFQDLLYKRSSPLSQLQRTYLRLAGGEYDEKFSAWLEEPSDDAADRMSFDRWNSKVCNYLGIPREASQDFLLSLREHL